MYEAGIEYLRTPHSRQPLRLHVYGGDSATGYIQEGMLEASDGSWFPVIRGVPRLLPPSLREELILQKHPWFFEQYRSQLPEQAQEAWTAFERQTGVQQHQLRTATSFGYEWKRFSKMFDEYRQNFLNYVQPFGPDDFRDKVVLDAGCGVGRHAYWAGKFGARHVLGADFSDAVEPAEQNCKELKNVTTVQADIYHLPFDRPFDFIFSIGVLHHLPNPEEGFRSLFKHLTNDGILLIWVYGRKNNNAAVYVYEPLRTVTRQLPKNVVVPLCHPFAGIVHGLNKLSDTFDAHELTRKLAALLPFQYYRRFPYEVKLNDAFDVLATPKSRYYEMETIKGWFERLGLEPSLQYLRKKSIIGYARAPRTPSIADTYE